MRQLEHNIVESFRLVKNDFMKVQDDIVTLSQTQERIMEMLSELNTTQKNYQDNLSKLSSKQTKSVAAFAQLKKRVSQMAKRLPRKKK